MIMRKIYGGERLRALCSHKARCLQVSFGNIEFFRDHTLTGTILKADSGVDRKGRVTLINTLCRTFSCQGRIH
jgi:hypothetical protein